MTVTINGTTGIDTPGLNSDNLVGQVCFFAMQTAPTGFLSCDGTAVSRTTYAALFAAIGTLYGAGDGTTTFNLPDLRGEFVRGWDNGRGVDSGRVFGSAQSSQNLSHTHSVTDPGHGHTTGAVALNSGSSGASLSAGAQWIQVAATVSSATTGISIQNNGGTEARPRNIALLACIKF